MSGIRGVLAEHEGEPAAGVEIPRLQPRPRLAAHRIVEERVREAGQLVAVGLVEVDPVARRGHLGIGQLRQVGAERQV
jgi:hypothetical protein